MKKVFVLALASMVLGSAVIAQTGDKECCKKKAGTKKCCKKEAKAEAKTATPAPAAPAK